MPRYDYRCTSCGVVYEKREGFDAPSVQACTQCQGEARRVLTPPAIVFKGSGWYVNDSRKSASGSDSSATAGSDAKTDAATPAKSETKTESKSESSNPSASPAASSAAAD